MQEEMEKLYPVNQLEKDRDALDQEERYYSKEMYDLKKTYICCENGRRTENALSGI